MSHLPSSSSSHLLSPVICGLRLFNPPWLLLLIALAWQAGAEQDENSGNDDDTAPDDGGYVVIDEPGNNTTLNETDLDWRIVVTFTLLFGYVVTFFGTMVGYISCKEDSLFRRYRNHGELVQARVISAEYLRALPEDGGPGAASVLLSSVSCILSPHHEAAKAEDDGDDDGNSSGDLDGAHDEYLVVVEYDVELSSANDVMSSGSGAKVTFVVQKQLKVRGCDLLVPSSHRSSGKQKRHPLARSPRDMIGLVIGPSLEEGQKYKTGKTSGVQCDATAETYMLASDGSSAGPIVGLEMMQMQRQREGQGRHEEPIHHHHGSSKALHPRLTQEEGTPVKSPQHNIRPYRPAALNLYVLPFYPLSGYPVSIVTRARKNTPWCGLSTTLCMVILFNVGLAAFCAKVASDVMMNGVTDNGVEDAISHQQRIKRWVLCTFFMAVVLQIPLVHYAFRNWFDEALRDEYLESGHYVDPDHQRRLDKRKLTAACHGESSSLSSGSTDVYLAQSRLMYQEMYAPSTSSDSSSWQGAVLT